MSASPAKPSPSAGVTPTGGTQMMRKKPPVSIFTQKKKPAAKKPQPLPARSNTHNQPPHAQQQHPLTNGTSTSAPASSTLEADTDYTDFPIVISKDSLKQGLHYHAMRLQTRSDKSNKSVLVNPYDPTQFTRPVHLHRRSARDKLETAAADQSDAAASGMDDKERELMSVRRAERQAEREANQALIAPTGGSNTTKPAKKKPQKKVEDVYYDENDPRQRARAQLRYEEARPWHLEDFDRKNVWVGSYEEPLTESSVMFEIGEAGFKMLPVERWYRFSQTNRVSGAMDSDQVEKHMGRKVKAPRWFMGTQESKDEMRRQAVLVQRERIKQQRDDEDGGGFGYGGGGGGDYQADVDEIDFEFNDEFQDDDEGFVFGVEENDETKEIEKRIREEMRGANLAGTGVKDEDRDWDAEEQKEKEKEREERRRQRRIRRQLIKKEKKNEYVSESDRGEFSESSESEDSESERERLENERKAEEAKQVNGAEKSGTSTKGTNTPSGRSEKRDPLTKPLSTSLKRPGSPDLSEVSGNESSRNRKRARGLNGMAISSNGAGRSLSPDSAKPPTVRTKSSTGYGSGSETDGTRTGRPSSTTKIRIKASPPTSPHEGNSRAVSPSGSNSRAQSPSRKAGASFPTLEEVRAAIPVGGIGISEIVKLFKGRISGSEKSQEFIALVKRAGKQDKESKKILPLKDGQVD